MSRDPEISETGPKANRFRPLLQRLFCQRFAVSGASAMKGSYGGVLAAAHPTQTEGACSGPGQGRRPRASQPCAQLCAQPGNEDEPGMLPSCCGAGSRHQRPHEMESAMARPFILAIIIGLAAFGSADAQSINSANPNSANRAAGGSPSQTATPGTASSGSARQADPAFIPQGPCSVSPNATGGVTTSSSCGTDPLSVPTQTLSSSSSPAQAGGGTARSTQSSGSGSSSESGSPSSGSSNTTASTTGSGGTAASNGGGGIGSPSSRSPACSSSLPSTSGTVGAGGLTGESGC